MTVTQTKPLALKATALGSTRPYNWGRKGFRVVEQVQPDEVYNLGAISFVKLSFSQPDLTANVIGSGVLRMLEAIRIVGGRNNRIRFYQAATSEMFGEVAEVPQRETTPFHPRSRTGRPKCSAITRRSIIASHTASMHPMASCSTTPAHGEAWSSSNGRSPMPWPVSLSACKAA